MRSRGRGGGGGIIGCFFVGVCFICFAFPLLWFNEKYQVILAKLYNFGEKKCVKDVDPMNPDPAKHNELVHCNGKLATFEPLVEPDVGF